MVIREDDGDNVKSTAVGNVFVTQRLVVYAWLSLTALNSNESGSNSIESPLEVIHLGNFENLLKIESAATGVKTDWYRHSNTSFSFFNGNALDSHAASSEWQEAWNYQQFLAHCDALHSLFRWLQIPNIFSKIKSSVQRWDWSRIPQLQLIDCFSYNTLLRNVGDRSHKKGKKPRHFKKIMRQSAWSFGSLGIPRQYCEKFPHVEGSKIRRRLCQSSSRGVARI